MKLKLVILSSFLLLFLSAQAQQDENGLSIYPIFPECVSVEKESLPICFNNAIRKQVLSDFQVPESLATTNYKGEVKVLFEVDQEGTFKVIYVDTDKDELREAVHDSFSRFPQIEGPTYNGKPTYMQFTVSFGIPLGTVFMENMPAEGSLARNRSGQLSEYDEVEENTYTSKEFTSGINIPLSHHNYSLFDPYLNQVGSNNHTAQKPYIYSEVNKYYDFAEQQAPLLRERKTWLGRKWWNEHMVAFEGKDYWVTLDPGVDLQVGKDFDDDIDTYNNTRLVYKSDITI